MSSAGWWKSRPELIAQVKKLLEEGFTAQQAATRLTIDTGVHITRNAIIGLNSREWLVPRKPRPKASPRPRRPQTDQRITPKLKAQATGAATIAEVPEVSSENAKVGFGPRLKTIIELEPGDCKWPVGNPRDDDFGFCGAEAIGPYCPDHTRVAFPPRKGG